MVPDFPRAAGRDGFFELTGPRKSLPGVATAAGKKLSAPALGAGKRKRPSKRRCGSGRHSDAVSVGGSLFAASRWPAAEGTGQQSAYWPLTAASELAGR